MTIILSFIGSVYNHLLKILKKIEETGWIYTK